MKANIPKSWLTLPEKEKQIIYKLVEDKLNETIDHEEAELQKRWLQLACIVLHRQNNAGYRKQIEGEWVAKTDYAGYGYYCSNCNAVFTGENAEWIAKEHHYCPKCGAHMRKEDEGK